MTDETTFDKKFLQGGPGGAVFSKSAPPGRRRDKMADSKVEEDVIQTLN